MAGEGRGEYSVSKASWRGVYTRMLRITNDDLCTLDSSGRCTNRWPMHQLLSVDSVSAEQKTLRLSFETPGHVCCAPSMLQVIAQSQEDYQELEKELRAFVAMHAGLSANDARNGATHLLTPTDNPLKDDATDSREKLFDSSTLCVKENQDGKHFDEAPLADEFAEVPLADQSRDVAEGVAANEYEDLDEDRQATATAEKADAPAAPNVSISSTSASRLAHLPHSRH